MVQIRSIPCTNRSSFTIWFVSWGFYHQEYGVVLQAQVSCEAGLPGVSLEPEHIRHNRKSTCLKWVARWSLLWLWWITWQALWVLSSDIFRVPCHSCSHFTLTGPRNVYNETLSFAWVIKDYEASRRSLKTDSIFAGFAA